ncbi:flagellar hook-associated protein 2 [Frankineae bacterium MT45]|nr:flagellar hook-associated protein 2 [Frankineae bacterium MT45]
MAAFSISGLASGIDTASLITQLMAVAAAPQTQLKTQLNTENSVIAAYQAINTKIAAVQTAAEALKASSTWTAATVASSNTSVVATASASAAAGSSATFDVTAVARAQTSTFSSTGGVVISGTPPNFTITTGGTTTSITAASGTPAAVAAAINSAGVGVRASVVNTDAGPILQLSSTGTGTANSFTTTGFDNPQKDVISAQDAQITVGDPANGGYTVSSSTNTFTDVIPGVTFTVSSLASGVNLSLSSDEAGISSKVQALVDSVNAAFSIIGQATAQGGILPSDSLSTKLQQSLLSTVAQGFSGGSYNQYGVTITSQGQMTFDSKAFANAYSADPTGTQAAIGTALGGAYDALGISATDSVKGSLTLAVKNDQATAADYTKQISAWDSKLADMQTALTAKYSAMETALSKLQSESTWLTSTLASITGSKSSSSS